MRAKELVPRPLRPLARAAYFSVYRAGIRARCWYLDCAQAKASAGGFAAPPALLRFRVGGTTDLADYAAVGEKTVSHLTGALEGIGRSFDQFDGILDFGCGCGRTLIWLADRFPDKHFFGMDVDGPSIRWAQRSLPFASFHLNGALPPTPFANESFDLIYGISVFTHLDEGPQREWLKELYRILKPGGLLMLSLHGEASWKELPEEDVTHLRRHGFLFKRSSKLRGIVPEWYHTAFHSREYATKMISEKFGVLAYLDQGLGYQDLVIVERASNG